MEPLDFIKCGALHFSQPDEETFQCLRACKRALLRGGLASTAANGANEEAVRLFLDRKISFLQIGELVMQAMEHQPDAEIASVEDILNADQAARAFVRQKAKV